MKGDNIWVSSNHQIPIVKQKMKVEREPFKLKHAIANRKTMYLISGLSLLVLAIVTNAVVNYIAGIIKTFNKVMATNKAEGLDRATNAMMLVLNNISKFFVDHVNTSSEFISLFYKPNPYIVVWLVLFGILGLAILKKIHSFYKKYRKLDYGQRGSSKFATVKELKKQYKAVPQQTLEYEGDPGVPMTHINDLPKIFQAKPFMKFVYNGKFLIDTATINTMVIGTSRSGKGESLVFPATDIDTRAKIKPSLVFADPKGELYAGSYETLRKRGYDVEVLNLVNPDDGMSYNMLQIIKDEYMKGDFAQAEQYCVTLTKTLFPGDGGDPFWDNAAASLVNALIFTVIHRALQENKPERITMRNVVDLLNTLGPETENRVDEETGESTNLLDEYIMSLPDGSIAKKQYATSAFAGGNTRSSILTVASTTLQIFTSEKLSKMGSANSVDFTRVGFNKRLRVKFDLKYIYTRGVVHYGYGEDDCLTSNFKVDSLGYMENNFKRKMKPGEIIRLEIEGDVFEYIFYREKPKSGFVSTKAEIDPYTGEKIYPKTAYLKKIDENKGVLETTCFYSEKPIAIFMVVPDYDSSIHVVSAVFISQLYTMLARRASESGGKCHQRVKFRLDEFGNFPPIHDMSNIMTVCLGRNILFELYVQGYSQVTAKYGQEDGETIKDNCQNHIYIKSTSKETNDEISAKCGMKTVTSTTRNRGGSEFSLEISETDSIEQVPIIEPDLLPKFVQGEQVILRFLKNTDNDFKSIRPDPIYNHDETATPFRFRYLGDDFEPANQFADFDIPSEHRTIKLSEYRIDWKSPPVTEKVVSSGFLAKSPHYTSDNKMKLKELCRNIAHDDSLYNRILQVQDEEQLHSAIQEVLESKSMSSNEIKTHSTNIRQLTELIQHGEKKEEKRNPLDPQSNIVIEEEPIYLSNAYFENEQNLTFLKKALKDNLPEQLYQVLEKASFTEFNTKFDEYAEKYNLEGAKELKIGVNKVRLN